MNAFRAVSCLAISLGLGLTWVVTTSEPASARCRGYFTKGGCLSVQLKSIQQLNPMCIGAPQDCKDTPAPQPASSSAPQPAREQQTYYAAYRVVCRDSQGVDRGDAITRASSSASHDDARRAVMERFNTTFGTLCHGIDSRYSADRVGEWVA